MNYLQAWPSSPGFKKRLRRCRKYLSALPCRERPWYNGRRTSNFRQWRRME